MEERECGNPSTEYRSACQCDEAPTTGESIEEYSFFEKNKELYPIFWNLQ